MWPWRNSFKGIRTYCNRSKNAPHVFPQPRINSLQFASSSPTLTRLSLMYLEPQLSAMSQSPRVSRGTTPPPLGTGISRDIRGTRDPPGTGIPWVIRGTLNPSRDKLQGMTFVNQIHYRVLDERRDNRAPSSQRISHSDQCSRDSRHLKSRYLTPASRLRVCTEIAV